MDTYNYNNWFAYFRWCMPVFILGGWFFTAVAAAQVKAKDPEAVYVAVERARLFAGPSTDFYPTGAADRGATLEVHHRTANGWLGVRPPQGSFSWVPASQAYMLPGGRVIEITDASAVSWIGTELGSAKQYRWQVQLNVGEQLGVLGEATIKNGSDDREALWYKVAPPAGEFRWIEEAAVTKEAPPTSVVQPGGLQVAANASAVSADSSRVGSVASSEVKSSVAGKSSAPAGVTTASFEAGTEQITAPKSARVARPNQAAPKHNPQPSAKPGSEWDGWYAFEVGERGVKAPFLDKLSGRDRGQSSALPKRSNTKHDPLIHDPFSLTMGGEPAAKPDPQQVVEAIRKERVWRDPRALREARLAGTSPIRPANSLETFVDRFDRALDGATGVLTASGERSVLVKDDLEQADAGVKTAGFDDTVRIPGSSQPPASAADVNWYGLSEANANDSAGLGAAHTNGSSSVPGLVGSSATGRSGIVTSTADVAELQVALNNAVSASNGPWNLSPLAEHARYLIEHGPTAIDRGQARLLLERIEEFQNVSARSQQLTGPQLPSLQALAQPSPGQPSAPLPREAPVQAASYSGAWPTGASAATSRTLGSNAPTNSLAHYDATGWLVPVHAAGADQPTHALTNDTGDIVAYVSPIAGLNLERYRNQAVGITGLRGYLPQLQAAHIQAQRVSRIR